jgi:hypothetical protein
MKIGAGVVKEVRNSDGISLFVLIKHAHTSDRTLRLHELYGKNFQYSFISQLSEH